MEIFYLLKIKKGTYYDENFCRDIGTHKLNMTDHKNYEKAGDSFLLVVMFFNKGEMPSEILIAKCNKKSQKGVFDYEVLTKTMSKFKIQSFVRGINLDLDKDFTIDSYFESETAIEIFNDFYRSLIQNNLTDSIEINEFCHESENSHCQSNKNAYTYYVTNKDNRSQYQRDRDRIVHSKANRRLVDKAQIFTSSKGDHYRTRMTHTIEVAQIARSLARELKLNEDLTEAIALGHDLGHTPFGHQGERTLDCILSGKIDIIKNCDLVKQGFKHNYQALRILTFLESKYAEYDGLNLSYQVMEGIWKHTKLKDDFEISDFFHYKNDYLLYPNQEFSSTLEGQIVSIADEVAQRSHDIDDAFKSKKITHENFMKYSSMRKYNVLVKINDDINEKINKAENKGVIFVDKDDMYRAQISSKLINYFIIEIVKKTEEKLKGYPIPEDNVYREKIVQFSVESEKISNLLESIINKQVINSSEVAKFDKTASRIITKLFKYYYENPLCLESSTLTRIYKEMLVSFDNCINFIEGDLDMVRDEINKIVNCDLDAIKDPEEKKEYIGKRKILVRCIADHISGMTDSFAINEYKKIYAI